MDLWYYFAHRGLELLAEDGTLAFIVSGYWTSGCGAEKLLHQLRRVRVGHRAHGGEALRDLRVRLGRIDGMDLHGAQARAGRGIGTGRGRDWG